MDKLLKSSDIYKNIAGLIIIVVICSLGGCKESEESVILNQAEALGIENPDSALKLLSKIDLERLSSKQKADFILYKEKANYYSGNSSESDTILIKAIEYYSKDSSKYKKELAECLYYQGHIQFNHGNPGKAIVCFIKSKDAYNELRDTLMMALCYRGLGDTYGEIQSYYQALQNYKDSYNLFNEINSEKYTPYAFYDLACAYYNNFEYAKSISVTDSVIDRYKNTPVSLKPHFISDCINLKLSSLYELKRYNEVISLYESYKDKNAILSDKLSVAALGISYYKLGMYEDLERLNVLVPNNLWVTMVLEDSRGNLKKVNELVIRQSDEQNNVMKEIVAGDYQQIVTDYYDTSKKLERAEKQIQKERFIIIFLILVFIFIIIVTALIIKSRNLKLKTAQNRRALMNVESLLRNMQVKDSIKNYELNKTKAEVAKLNSLIDEFSLHKHKETDNTNRIIKLYRGKFGLISQIVESNFQSKNAESASKRVFTFN